MLAAHLQEWLDCGPCMAKSAGQAAVQTPSHPLRAVDEGTDRLSRAYRAMLADMNAAIVDYLQAQAGKDPF